MIRKTSNTPQPLSDPKYSHRSTSSFRDSPKVPRNVILMVLLGLILSMGLLRFHTYDEPVQMDLTSNAVVANEWLHGKTLYS